MARDQKRQPSDKEVPTVSPVVVSDGIAEQTRHDQLLSQKQRRIKSCLQTIAILLEENDAYLPLFLRLEKELEIEQVKRETIDRARQYLPNLSH